MKRTLLDITQKLSRKPNSTKVQPYNLYDDNYWIFYAKGWRFVEVLREVEILNKNHRLFCSINTQYISGNDYIIEESGGNIFIKFIKANFPYSLDEDDYIEIKGDIEYYA